MPVTVPTADETAKALNELQGQIEDLTARVAALEAGTTPPDPVDPPDPEPTPEPPDPPPPGTLQVVVQLGGQQYVFNEAEGRDIGTYQDPDGRFSERCTRVTHPDTPLRIDVRRMEGRTSVVFGQGYWQDAEHVNLGAYTATIQGDELPTPATFSVPSHAAYQRTRWTSAPWPLPLRKMADLYDRKLLPRFDPALTKGTEYSWGPYSYEPMSLAGLCGYMPQTGGRADLGHVTITQGYYICHEGDPQALADMMAQAEAGGTFTWDYCDRDTNAVIDPLEQYPQSTLYAEYAGTPYISYSPASSMVDVTYSGPPGSVLSPNGSPPAWNYWWSSNNVQGRVPVDTRIPDSGSITLSCEVFSGTPDAGPGTVDPPVDGVSCTIVAGTFAPGSGITIDSAHQPALAYLPFLLTGDPYHLETLQRQVSFIIMENASAPVRSYGVIQPRATGWSARTLASCAKVSPENPPSWLLPKRIYVDGINRWAEQYFYPETVANPANIRQVIGSIVGSYANETDGTTTWIQHYQDDMGSGGLGWLALLHPDTKWPEIVKWNSRHQIARLDPQSGWSLAAPTLYYAKMSETDYPDAYASWSDAWEGNEPYAGCTYSDTVPPATAGGMDYYTWMSTGMAIQWQAGADNAEALCRLMDAIAQGLTAQGVYMEANRCIAVPTF